MVDTQESRSPRHHQRTTISKLWIAMMSLALILFTLELFYSLSYPLTMSTMVTLSLDAVFVILLVIQWREEKLYHQTG